MGENSVVPRVIKGELTIAPPPPWAFAGGGGHPPPAGRWHPLVWEGVVGSPGGSWSPPVAHPWEIWWDFVGFGGVYVSVGVLRGVVVVRP